MTGGTWRVLSSDAAHLPIIAYDLFYSVNVFNMTKSFIGETSGSIGSVCTTLHANNASFLISATPSLTLPGLAPTPGRISGPVRPGTM
eukprot:9479398-Pyramimonas_sp.AAC.1